ncbi:MAG: extradiol ring-cleavage dioxygenase [Gammaproteobacteria bacterium]|nr:extradiol ring-cleavage dioxygenase [Gammaproteobacteria bacterium]
MTLCYSGIVSHAPGITGRADLVQNTSVRDALYAAFARQRAEIEASKPDVLLLIAAEHFANFFMNNMPSFCIGTGESHTGPIEDPVWLKIPARRIAGAPELAGCLVRSIMQSVDMAYAEEWQCNHGLMVPLHFLDPDNRLPLIPMNINCQGPPLAPLHRVWAFGEAIREAVDQVPERIAVLGTGGISHWPATPDSGKINEAWDREFLGRLFTQDKKALLSYSDEDTYRDAGQGGFEIRTLIAAAAVAGTPGRLQFYTAELPIFAVGCAIGRFWV